MIKRMDSFRSTITIYFGELNDKLDCETYYDN